MIDKPRRGERRIFGEKRLLAALIVPSPSGEAAALKSPASKCRMTMQQAA